MLTCTTSYINKCKHVYCFYNSYLVYRSSSSRSAKESMKNLKQNTHLTASGLSPGTKYKLQIACKIKGIEIPKPIKLTYASTKPCQSEYHTYMYMIWHINVNFTLGQYVGMYRSGAISLKNHQMQYPKSITKLTTQARYRNITIKSQRLQYFHFGTSKFHKILGKIPNKLA